MAITADSLRAALALYRDPEPWAYAPLTGGVRRCYYPVESRVRAKYLPQAGPQHTDCCCYVEGVVLAAAGGPKWPKARHRRAVISSEEQAEALDWLQRHRNDDTAEHRRHREALHGLPDELAAVDLADVVHEDTNECHVGEWWVGQWWDRDWSSGHAVLLEGGEDAWIVHEASKSAGRVIAREVTLWPVPGGYWRRWARLRVEP